MIRALGILVSLLLAVALALPLLSIATTGVVSWLVQGGESFVAVLFMPAFWHTLLLVGGVATLATLLGTMAAWWVTVTDLPGRGVWAWLLPLPLAMPAYISAYVYTDFLEYSGVVQTALRQITGWQTTQDYLFPEVRSLYSAIILMGTGFSPYVYLLVQASLRQQGNALLAASQTLGRGQGVTLWRIALPLLRPAMAGGAALALMETLADYGAVSHYAVSTLGTVVLRTWHATADALQAAPQALWLLVLALVFLGAEKYIRRRTRIPATVSGGTMPLFCLSCRQRVLALAVCGGITGTGFLLPLLLLAKRSLDARWSEDVWRALGNTILFAGGGALGILCLALLLVVLRGKAIRLLSTVTSLGYAMPGSVIALGLLMLMERLPFLAGLPGTIGVLFYAWSVRFLALPWHTLKAGMAGQPPQLAQAARTLGADRLRRVMTLHLPLLRPHLLAAFSLLVLDIARELPATLVLRPFDRETLATFTFNLASDEQLTAASPAALLLVAVCSFSLMVAQKFLK